MQVILLERVEKLGQMGDEVRVKDGFARNFLLPKKKALRATKANREYFQTQKAQLEAHNLERKKDAEAVAKKLDGKSFILIRQAGDRGQLYGSVSPRDIADAIEKAGFKVDRTPGADQPGDQVHRPVRHPGGAASGSAGERHRQCRAQRGRSRAPGPRRKCAGGEDRRRGSRRGRRGIVRGRRRPQDRGRRPRKPKPRRNFPHRMKKAGLATGLFLCRPRLLPAGQSASDFSS